MLPVLPCRQSGEAARQPALWSGWRGGWAAVTAAAVGSCSPTGTAHLVGPDLSCSVSERSQAVNTEGARCGPSAREDHPLFACPQRLLSRKYRLQVKPKSHKLAGVP